MKPVASRLGAVAFDLDGTLVDSAPDIANALNLALQGAGLRGFDLETVRGWVGAGPDATIARALAAQGRGGAEEALRLRLRHSFEAATLAAPLQFGAVYEGIAALLAGLQGVLPLVVVTNKPTLLARAVLSAGGLLPALAAVHGADTPAQRKPSPLLLRRAAEELGVRTEALLMVGDGPPDIAAARAAGCPAAQVAWGYGPIASSDGGVWHVATPQHLLASVLGRHHS